MASSEPVATTTTEDARAVGEVHPSSKTNVGGQPAKPLETRHVFLDTQVYRSIRHSPANPLMGLLLKQIEAHRIVLHTADITLLEVKRQIRESMIAHNRDLEKIEKDLGRWRLAARDQAPSPAIAFDIEALATEIFGQFDTFVRVRCQAVTHAALTIPAGDVFENYFRRDPPFNKPESKEFPDGFVFEALSRWCKKEKERLYVVTQDGAFLKAAEGHASMLPMKDIHHILASAAVGLDGEANEEAIASAALDGQDFDGSFEMALQDQIKDVVFVYAGDLPEGEAYQGELVAVEEIDGWSVVGLSSERITLILSVVANVKVEVQYEDREDAIYDREDDIWFGAETGSTDVREEVRLEVLVDLDRERGNVLEAKVLTPEVTVHGSTEYDY